MESATASLPMSSASIRSLAMPGLAGALKDKKYSSLSSKLELKGLVKPETTSSTHSTLHLSRFIFHQPIIPLYCLPDSYVKSISQAKNQWL